MGKYDGWDRYFGQLEGHEHELTFEQLEDLIDGSLPPSAYRHYAWWAGTHYYAKWRDHGWFIHPDLSRQVARFDRRTPHRGRPPRAVPWDRLSPPPPSVSEEVATATLQDSRPRLVLVGCVAQKRTIPSPAKDLYVSDLWYKRRSYAESTGQPWMILSAEHGLVDPNQTLEPYDRYLESQPASYREQWSRVTADAVLRQCRELGIDTVEIHAGAAYIKHGLQRTLEHAGILVLRPLEGMRIGEQLSWYRWGGGEAPSPIRQAQPPPPPRAAVPGHELVQLIAETYRSKVLGESWDELPEAWERPGDDPRSQRLWITFVASVDRARDAAALWRSAHRAFRQDPWVFEPHQVAHRSMAELADTLRFHGLSQRHAPDSRAWKMIGEALADSRCPPAIRAAIDGDPVSARDVLAALSTTLPYGTPMFPQLSGVKIGPMWVRMLVWPGGAPISDIEVIPVAVDTHVQRVSEMLGVVPVRSLDDQHRIAIQQAWFEAVRDAGPFGAPEGIDGTSAGIDPALWVLGKEGCSRCEREGRRVAVGAVCDVCALGRLRLTAAR